MDAQRKGARVLAGIVCALGVGAGGTLFVLSRPQAEARPAVPRVAARPDGFRDAFDRPELDSAAWISVADGDFQERVVDVQSGRLRLRCATVGTNDRTVKYLGVRSVAAVPLRDGRKVSAELDWNNQANGSYLSSALVLAPAATEGNPLLTSDWIKIEYVGVPPGKNGRLVVGRRAKGRELPLFTEGWPESNRNGRPIARQKIELILRGDGVDVLENGIKVFSSHEKLPFEAAHLYLLMSSHSNYPPRELYWDNVRIE